jgi:flagellar biosynthesis/type III secretory pathway protein FliH
MNIKAFTYEIFGDFEDVAFTENAPKKSLGEVAPEVKAEVAPEVIAPTFSQEEVEMAKNLAREEGIRQGYEEARIKFEEDKKANDAKATELLDKLNFQIAGLAKQNEQKKKNTTDEIAKIAFSIAKTVCGKMPNQYIEEEIRSIINQSLEKFDRGEKVKIWLNPKNAADLNDKFTHAELNSDEGLELGDFRIEWNNGFAERNMKKLWEEVEATISRHSSFDEEQFNEETK